MALLFYVCFLLCAAAGVALVLRHDLHEREPPLAVALAILTGFLATPFLGRLEDGIVFGITSTPSLALIALAAGVVEEGARAGLVTVFAMVDRRRFNDPMDGIVYGSLLGAGMAIYEGAYSVGWEGFDPFGETFAREFVRLYGHMVLGGIAGYAAGCLRRGYRGTPFAIVLAPATAAALHFLVDLGSLTAATDPGGRVTGTVVVVLAVLLATLLRGGLTIIASERSRLLFAPSSALRLVGWPLDLILGRLELSGPSPAPGHDSGGDGLEEGGREP